MDLSHNSLLTDTQRQKFHPFIFEDLSIVSGTCGCYVSFTYQPVNEWTNANLGNLEKDLKT